MAVLGGGQMIGYYPKRSPKFTKGDMKGFGSGNKIVFARYPKDYPLTPQQKKIREVAHKCGIKAGMSRGDLINAMRTCVKDSF